MKRWLVVIGRLILGVIFVYAAYVKLKAPWIEFAGSLAAYKLLPDDALEPLAKIVPWVELILGVGMISGLLQRWFSLAVSLMLLLFFSVMVRSYAMGLQIDCGCFGPGEALGPKTLARDFSMLAVSVAVTVASFRMKKPVAAENNAPPVIA